MFVSVVLDIPTRALARPYDYSVPSELTAEASVGATVLVEFSHRMSVGYVVDCSDTPPEGVDPSKIQPVQRVLAEPAFDRVAARLALWMASEYAAPLADCVRLFLPPGQTMRVRRENESSAWQLVVEKAGPVDDRWVSLTPKAQEYEPPKTAVRQRAVIEALRGGSMRLAELSALAPGARSAVTSLAKKGVVSVAERRRVRGGAEQATTLSSAAAARPEQHTQGQRDALAAIAAARASAAGGVVLVDGVTGSGKTEVYLSAIEDVLAQGKGALVLVPEISLTAQTVGRFRGRFGDAVAVLHSRLSTGERYDQWDLVRRGEARVVVGARSTLFAPMRDVGLIIIDEEHEPSYKQDSSPRYHARDLAAELARRRGAALVLGSATPSLEALERAHAGTWRGATWTRVEMPERPGGALLPRVRVVDMCREFGTNRSVFSAALREALLGVAQRGEKAVLLLNRRGFAPFLMCRECGCVPSCPHCSSALTYHERGHKLACHSCGGEWSVVAYPNPATRCPSCGSPYLAQVGIGTQRVEDELKMLMPSNVDIIRMDADSTKHKGGHQRLLEQFDASDCAVLVGTQMIAKGLDFPEVTLVGVVNADTSLKLPDFRAAERTYDLLEQVAGRAGRGEKAGEVIVQTYWAGHPAIAAVAKHRRSIFLDAERAEREEADYPPFSRLGNVIFSGTNELRVREASARLAELLRANERCDEVLGPTDCVRAKVKDRFRRHVMIKAGLDCPLGELLSDAVARLGPHAGVSIAVDVDAYDMM